MLKKRRSLQVEFWACIAIAFLIVLVLPISVKESCEPSWKNHWGIYGDSRAEQSYYTSNKIHYALASQQQQTNDKHGISHASYREYLKRSGFCEEAKITDMALVFFTCCLVIVGWFTIRSAEDSTRHIERAYLWPGFGKYITISGGVQWDVTLLNTGRTAGIIQHVYHALISEDDFKAGRFSYSKFVDRENIIPPTERGKEIRTGVKQDVTSEPKISCGYIVYTDVYGHTHEQGWKHRLHGDGTSDSLLGCYSDPPDKNH